MMTTNQAIATLTPNGCCFCGVMHIIEIRAFTLPIWVDTL